MIHGQGIQAQPRHLLRAIPGLQLREASEAGVCCGSAGIYNLVQYEEAAELGRIKADDLSNTGAELVASANIGCTLQLRRHLDGRARVHHPMELLAASAGLHPLPGIPQGVSAAEVAGEGEDRQPTEHPPTASPVRAPGGADLPAARPPGLRPIGQEGLRCDAALADQVTELRRQSSRQRAISRAIS